MGIQILNILAIATPFYIIPGEYVPVEPEVPVIVPEKQQRSSVGRGMTVQAVYGRPGQVMHERSGQVIYERSGQTFNW